jgi:hypothetical protein
MFIDIMSRQSQAYRMLSYMIQGQFIGFATTKLEVALVTYNPDLRRFVSTKVIFEYTVGGQIQTRSYVQVLNVGLYEGTSGQLLFLAEMVTIAWILWMGYGEVREYMQTLRSADFNILSALGSHFVDRDSSNMLEFASISLQITAFVVWWFYQLQYAFNFLPTKRYEVYYTAPNPVGNFLLPVKDRARNSQEFTVGGEDENGTYTAGSTLFTST